MGFIYKIEVGEECYIGSTKQKYLSQRQADHNKLINNPNSKAYNYSLYKFCREHNVRRIKCELLETVEDSELKILEQEYIKMLKPSLNTYRAFQTKEDRKEQNKNYHKEKVKCDKCGVIINKTYLKNHQSRMSCRKFWDSSLLNSEDEE